MNTEENNTQLPQSSVSVSAFLTGKAKQDFEKWLKQKDSFLFDDDILRIDDLHHFLLNGYITEWFDEIGFHIKIYPHLGGGQNVFYPSFIYRDEKYNENERNVLFDNGELYYSINRQEAINEVVKKANIIYNEKVVQAEH